MALGQFLFGSPNRFERIPKYEPNQIQGFNQALQMALQGLQNPSQGFEPIAQQARKQFSQQTVPGLAERFTSMGSASLSSPAFASQLGSASADLESQLAALQSQYGLQNQSQLMQLLGLGLTPQSEIGYFQGQPGAAQGIGQGLSQFAPLALGAIPGMGWLSRLTSLLGSLGGR